MQRLVIYFGAISSKYTWASFFRRHSKSIMYSSLNDFILRWNMHEINQFLFFFQIKTKAGSWAIYLKKKRGEENQTDFLLIKNFRCCCGVLNKQKKKWVDAVFCLLTFKQHFLSKQRKEENDSRSFFFIFFYNFVFLKFFSSFSFKKQEMK